MLLALVVHARRGNIRVSEPLLPCFLKSVSYGYTLGGQRWQKGSNLESDVAVDTGSAHGG